MIRFLTWQYRHSKNADGSEPILEMVYFDGEPNRARMDEALDLALRGVE